MFFKVFMCVCFFKVSKTRQKDLFFLCAFPQDIFPTIAQPPPVWNALKRTKARREIHKDMF